MSISEIFTLVAVGGAFVFLWVLLFRTSVRGGG
jgi:hypothetical protein